MQGRQVARILRKLYRLVKSEFLQIFTDIREMIFQAFVNFGVSAAGTTDKGTSNGVLIPSGISIIVILAVAVTIGCCIFVIGLLIIKRYALLG